jgi:hypothetical protein
MPVTTVERVLEENPDLEPRLYGVKLTTSEVGNT